MKEGLSPIFVLCAVLALFGGSASAATLYSIGEPTDEEQLYVEMINRARANPPAEGVWLSQSTNPAVRAELSRVNTNLMISQFAAIAAAPPLSISAQLTIAARLHSGAMYTNVHQSHQEPGEPGLGTRATLQGYNFMTLGENVYAYARDVEHGHAGFNVDWGTNGSTGRSVGGMQDPAGHRNNIHSPEFKEIGVGIVLGNRTNGNNVVGPQLVTQDFGDRFGITPFITGVAYYDLNGNNFYDLGEGIGGVSIVANGTTFRSASARSGGFSLPVPGNGTYQVSFSGTNYAGSNTTVTVAGGQNKKADLILPYPGSHLTQTNGVAAGIANTVAISVLPFANSHLVTQSRLTPFTTIEGGETLSNLTFDISAGYNPQNSALKSAGNFSIRLAHPTPPRLQTATFTKSLFLASNSSLSFRSQMHICHTSQVARVEVTTDQGQNWVAIWSQTGVEGQGETSFKTVNVSLAQWAGKIVQFRLAFAYNVGGFYYIAGANNEGWFVDQFQVANSEEISATTSTETSTDFVSLIPPTAGTYLYAVYPKIGTRTFPAPAPQRVQVQNALTARITSIRRLPSTQVEVNFTATSPVVFLESKTSINEAWAGNASALVESLGGSLYRSVWPATSSSNRFFRVRMAP